jgi:hypothetical protein
VYIRLNKFFGGESKSKYTQKVILEEVFMILQINARKLNQNLFNHCETIMGIKY